MPVYYVYDLQSGEIVQRHEVSNIASDSSAQLSSDEVLGLVGAAFKDRSLGVVEEEAVNPMELTLDGPGVRIDLNTRALTMRESI